MKLRGVVAADFAGVQPHFSLQGKKLKFLCETLVQECSQAIAGFALPVEALK